MTHSRCVRPPRPFVIPFFINHQGCPHRCVFCNQNVITGRAAGSVIDASQIRDEITAYLQLPHKASRKGVQVAFYGGSFTGLKESRQRELLGAVAPFLASGEVDLIRLSTRPDYIDDQIVTFLKGHGVGIVELGVQSMDDRVLAASGRGHTAADTERAIGCIHAGGLEVGVQLMVGLPGDRPGLTLAGAERLASLRPELARIYPVVVLRGSGLEEEYRAGRFQPLSLARAVALSGKMKEIFAGNDVRVVRIGLQETDGLREEIIAGPFHPAFGEMVLSRNLYCQVKAALVGARGQGPRRLRVAAADQSVLRGPGNFNLKRLVRQGLLDGIELVFCEDHPRGAVALSPAHNDPMQDLT